MWNWRKIPGLRAWFGTPKADAPLYTQGIAQPVAENIISAFDPWVLACAVGAENGSIGTRMGYEGWLDMSEENWMPAVQQALHYTTKHAIRAALRDFVLRHKHLNYLQVLKDVSAERGLAEPLVLEPGESVTVTVPIRMEPE